MLHSNEHRWLLPGDAAAMLMAAGALSCQLGLLLRHAASPPPNPPPHRAPQLLKLLAKPMGRLP